MVRRITKARELNRTSLIADFPRYLQIFERDPPFRRYGQWEYHFEAIKRRRALGSAKAALTDDEFLAGLYKTLQAWGIGIRGSKLRSVEEFVSSLRTKGPEIIALDGTAIDDPRMNVHETGKQVWHLIDTLGIVDNKTRIVPGTKALHHLLPELVVPMDRAYTQVFFCWQNPIFQYEQQRCFEHAFAAFAEVARKVNPAQYVGQGHWHTSRTKVIDNALIGLIFDRETGKPEIKEDEVASSSKMPPKLPGAMRPSLRFHSPPIEPDVRISRTRLSDQLHLRAYDDRLPGSKMVGAIFKWFKAKLAL
jgi:hypothetical protein